MKIAGVALWIWAVGAASCALMVYAVTTGLYGFPRADGKKTTGGRGNSVLRQWARDDVRYSAESCLSSIKGMTIQKSIVMGAENSLESRITAGAAQLQAIKLGEEKTEFAKKEKELDAAFESLEENEASLHASGETATRFFYSKQLWKYRFAMESSVSSESSAIRLFGYSDSRTVEREELRRMLSNMELDEIQTEYMATVEEHSGLPKIPPLSKYSGLWKGDRPPPFEKRLEKD
jgi:hypothetical protein